MTNKEKYKQAFSALHPSNPIDLEGTTMKNTGKTHILFRPVAAIICIVLLLGCATVAYAADVGGIRRTIQLWIHGDQTSAVLDIQDGQYTVSYEDAEGNAHQFGGGGVAFNPDGSERSLTEEEIMEHLNQPEVEYRDDGTVWLYYMKQAMEITDQFDEDNVCFIQLKNGAERLYVTVKYDNGYAMSPNAFVQPWEFNTSTD